MLLDHIDPFFAELDRVSKQAFGAADGVGMPMDVTRKGDELIVRADLPGVALDAIDIGVQGRTLTLKAPRKAGFGSDEQVLIQERLDGTLTRRLRVPDWVDSSAVSAEYADGVLTVRLPLAEQARPRRIEVQAGSAPVADSTAITSSTDPAA
jgi:HSP20 family protein